MGICQYQRPDKSDVGIFKKIAIRRQAPVEDRFRETGEKDMRYDFTKIIDRHGKDAIAVDGLGKNPGFAPEPPKDGFDVIPMWVADMNFEKRSWTGQHIRHMDISIRWKSIMIRSYAGIRSAIM